MVDFVATLEGRMEVLPLASLSGADAAFDDDPRDQTTPRDMANLLRMIWTRQAGLSDKATQILLGIMANCRTGKGRLPALLPYKQPVMHKTGSLGGRANDVGFIQLPTGHTLAIAVFVKGPAGPGQSSTAELYAERDKVIANLARTSYDFFLFHG